MTDRTASPALSLRDLVATAVLAPPSHNTQPCCSARPPRVSTCWPTLLPDPVDPDLLATISLASSTPRAAEAHHWFEAVATRRTTRPPAPAPAAGRTPGFPELLIRVGTPTDQARPTLRRPVDDVLVEAVDAE